MMTKLRRHRWIVTATLLALALLVFLWSHSRSRDRLLNPEIPKVLPLEPAQQRPAPELPVGPDVNAPVNTELKLVPPRKGLPPAPPVPDLKKVLSAPVNKELKLLPPREGLPPAPPLPPVQFPDSNQ